MKKIINGVRYDTDKATLVGEAGYGRRSDFAHWEAGLYVSPRAGRYFLAGEGGGLSLFARQVDGNSWTGGSGIIPLDREEALEWAERHLDTEVVERQFGDVIEEA